jgi:hypothetical protein
MNSPPHPMPVHTCHADGACGRPPRFQAYLDAADGTGPVHTSAEACSDHLGDMVQALTDWARRRRLTGAQLRLFAIDRPADGTDSTSTDSTDSTDGTDSGTPPDPAGRGRGGRGGPDTLSLAVSTMRLTE